MKKIIYALIALTSITYTAPTDSVVIGSISSGNAKESGATASTTSQGSVAIGKGATVDAIGGIAIGHNAKADAKASDFPLSKQNSKAIAIGYGAEAHGENVITLGSSVVGKRSDKNKITASGGILAIGLSDGINRNNPSNAATYVEGYSSIGIGAKVTVNASRSIALGELATVGKFTIQSMNQEAVVVQQGTAIGYRASVDSNDSISLGSGAKVLKNSAYSIAINGIVEEGVEGAIALGYKSKANRVAGSFGYDFETEKKSTKEEVAWKATHAALSIGEDGKVTRQITGVAAGTKDTDAVNLAQLKSLAAKITASASGADIEKVKSDLKKVELSSTKANEGAANATAIASLPSVSGKLFNLATSYGYFNGHHSLALGLNGEVNSFAYKLSGSLSNKGSVSFGVGLSYSLDKNNYIEDKDIKIKNLEDKIEKLEKLVEKLVK